jgi:hypothetical protein
MTWYQSLGSEEKEIISRHIFGGNTRRVIFLFLNILKIDERFKGATDFRAWKARVLLLLEENELKYYV